MTRREKALLGAAAASLIYGVVGFISPWLEETGRIAPDAVRTAQAKDIEEAVRAAVGEDRPEPMGAVEARVMALLRERSVREPFLDSAHLPRTAEPERPVGDDPPFAYSGFLQAGGKTFAVINGIEYQIGEELAEGEYVLKRATADQAVIARKPGGREIVVLFKDGGAGN